MKKIMARGRVLGNGDSQFGRLMESAGNTRTFTLKSGKTATFVFTAVMCDEIEEKTFVDQSINGRDQSLLTPESVSDISRTISLQQFFPAIGREVNGRIEILDGTRRRLACILSKTKFDILVTKDEIDAADARQLASDIQTAREHSLRELGKRFEFMYSNGMNKDEIAKAEGISPAKVSRAFQAAAVPDPVVSVFSDISELTLSDYQLLLKIFQNAENKDVSAESLADNVQEKIAQYQQKNAQKPTKEIILQFYRNEDKGLSAVTPKTVVIEKLKEYTGKNQFARKKTDAKKRTVVYEFSRLSAELQADIDEAIKAILSRDSM